MNTKFESNCKSKCNNRNIIFVVYLASEDISSGYSEEDDILEALDKDIAFDLYNSDLFVISNINDFIACNRHSNFFICTL